MCDPSRHEQKHKAQPTSSFLVIYPSRWSFSFTLEPLHWSSSWQWQPCTAGRFFQILLWTELANFAQFFCKMYLLYMWRSGKICLVWFEGILPPRCTTSYVTSSMTTMTTTSYLMRSMTTSSSTFYLICFMTTSSSTSSFPSLMSSMRCKSKKPRKVHQKKNKKNWGGSCPPGKCTVFGVVNIRIWGW